MPRGGNILSLGFRTSRSATPMVAEPESLKSLSGSVGIIKAHSNTTLGSWAQVMSSKGHWLSVLWVLEDGALSLLNPAQAGISAALWECNSSDPLGQQLLGGTGSDMISESMVTVICLLVHTGSCIVHNLCCWFKGRSDVEQENHTHSYLVLILGKINGCCF